MGRCGLIFGLIRRPLRGLVTFEVSFVCKFKSFTLTVTAVTI